MPLNFQTASVSSNLNVRDLKLIINFFLTCYGQNFYNRTNRKQHNFVILCIAAFIAEVVLYSEGFESSKTLARKMVQMYRLCSEQLSQQDHYDFGMRAVKSVLVMAGALKRGNPDLSEDVVLIRALRDSNLPKFLADDTVLFKVKSEVNMDCVNNPCFSVFKVSN